MENDPIWQAAADWLVRLQQPTVSLEETMEWQRWVNADPRHARAFERTEDLWHTCAQLEWSAGESGVGSAIDDYDGAESVTNWLAHQPISRRGLPLDSWSKGRKRATWVIAAAALVLGAVVAQMFLINTSRATSFMTSIGRNATVQLADGSTIELAGHSRCDVRLDRHRRMVTLVQGEALFHVSKDPHRPFQVRAGSANVEAVGTEFDVRRMADRVIVSVVAGRVLVQPVEQLLPVSWVDWTYTNGAPMTLGAGSQTTVNPTGIESQQSVTDTDAALSWRHGRLAFEREPLRDVIEDVNRYSTMPIALDDERIGDMLITGTVSSSDIEGWIASLQSAFGLRAERHANRIILKRTVPSE